MLFPSVRVFHSISRHLTASHTTPYHPTPTKLIMSSIMAEVGRLTGEPRQMLYSHFWREPGRNAFWCSSNPLKTPRPFSAQPSSRCSNFGSTGGCIAPVAQCPRCRRHTPRCFRSPGTLSKEVTGLSGPTMMWPTIMWMSTYLHRYVVLCLKPIRYRLCIVSVNAKINAPSPPKRKKKKGNIQSSIPLGSRLVDTARRENSLYLTDSRSWKNYAAAAVALGASNPPILIISAVEVVGVG
ncbi:hypothetical protein FN846DRAFT_249866 [Sphaerosporella brunnea]|uniref:Uncharacterized protein n=1 Tax=Sphaerosporella brunnea TaxID=1250544 RepID=A0A5J5FCT0_9PEZI|nr:hypothetical protein FN846DRAFT_249866 [Sphaerosporella brunnea]